MLDVLFPRLPNLDAAPRPDTLPAIARLELHHAFPSLKAVIEQNHTFEQMPEMFCFGLLEAFDMEQLMALVAPRPVQGR